MHVMQEVKEATMVMKPMPLWRGRRSLSLRWRLMLQLMIRECPWWSKRNSMGLRLQLVAAARYRADLRLHARPEKGKTGPSRESGIQLFLSADDSLLGFLLSDVKGVGKVAAAS
jgi:hypothetical protein